MNKDKIRIKYFGSGSEGNSALIEFGEVKLLVDAGISIKKIENELINLGIKLNDLYAVIITHEHFDHVKSLYSLLKRYQFPIITSEQTKRALLKYNLELDNKNFIQIKPNKEREIYGVRIFPFKVLHDAAEPMGLRFEWKQTSLVIVSDCGTITDEVYDHSKNSDILCIESNYDQQLLAACSYPDWLKQRIRSNRGHLNNLEVVNFLKKLSYPISHLVFIHISQESNKPEIIKRNIMPIVGKGCLQFSNITFATQDEGSPLLEIVTPSFQKNSVKISRKMLFGKTINKLAFQYYFDF